MFRFIEVEPSGNNVLWKECLVCFERMESSLCKNLDVSRYLYITLSHYFFFGLTSDHMNLCIIITMKQKGLS